MEYKNITIEDRLGNAYNKHFVFEQLKSYSDFYDLLSDSKFEETIHGIRPEIRGFHMAQYLSIKGTIDSIKDILSKGRINDAYALLRKYYDGTMTNIYVDLYLEENYQMENILKENFSIEDLMVKKIDNWTTGMEPLPEYRVINNYIINSPKSSGLYQVIHKDDRYKRIRERCNDNTHYNYFYNMLRNDSIDNPNRVKYLEIFAGDIEALFIQHIAYIFYLDNCTMRSSNYTDCMMMGIEPEEGSEYWVASYVQEIFDTVIKPKRYDIAKVIKENTMMDLAP